MRQEPREKGENGLVRVHTNRRLISGNDSARAQPPTITTAATAAPTERQRRTTITLSPHAIAHTKPSPAGLVSVFCKSLLLFNYYYLLMSPSPNSPASM
jgi:hypothetical protein